MMDSPFYDRWFWADPDRHKRRSKHMPRPEKVDSKPARRRRAQMKARRL